MKLSALPKVRIRCAYLGDNGKLGGGGMMTMGPSWVVNVACQSKMLRVNIEFIEFCSKTRFV